MNRNKHSIKYNLNSSNQIKKYIDIGKCIKIIDCKKNYQIIGFNPKMNLCWVREWPLNFYNYQTFALSINKISFSSSCELKLKK